ncbi:unnamed protein product, partial [Prorocentrum cordatum]
ATILFYLLAKLTGGPSGADDWAYDWAVRGRSSERAARVQACIGATVAKDLAHAVAHFDLAKCFDDAARSMRIVLDGSSTVGARWARGNVAGSRFAPVCLEMVIFAALGGAAAAFPWADARLSFDDLA